MHVVDNTQCQDAFFTSPRRHQEWRPSSKSQAEKNEVKILSSVAPLLMFDKHRLELPKWGRLAGQIGVGNNSVKL